jgi:hypothetical protein
MGKSKDKSDKWNKRNKKDNSDYPVGYKKPPLHTQFKPGQSGNTKGRPKKRATITDVVEELLRRIVSVNIDGKVWRITMMEAIALTHISKAAKGDHKSAILVLNQLKPAESAQNDNLPDLLQQFRTINASRKTSDRIPPQSGEPERDSTTPSDALPKIERGKDKE